MLIKTPKSSDLKESEVTPENVYLNRRDLLKGLGFLGAGALLANSASANAIDWFSKEEKVKFKTTPLKYQADANSNNLILTPENKVTTHNNFYEFGAQKQQPAELSQSFKVNPWQLTISGECDNPITLDYDDLTTMFALEERIYRLRCVEAWSMNIPWIGFSLADLLKKVVPNSSAKYVFFETLHDPIQMPGQANRRLGGGIAYPYVEGLRIDEAMNPLTLLSVGLYGKTLPPQNGAPIRLVVPWKYGFKSIKSIVSIKLVSEQPQTTWHKLAANEYGFYANVNPKHDHPRWSQSSERHITSGGLFARNRIKTLPFNGYGEQVAHLYKGMDLRKYY
ncbi:MAG: protein-methionine-sulfoxide reductase catalytic subunit MsrP [Colwellia sp.]|uniref:protein-methionine-sulfoxide reductase catalytic subunit MsrP n=1 Tax=Colwellia sp. TaxID=56799 RepID=UPI0025C53EA2|nr:protein-methionine-sulfoxide reductase catalytic subunit MsrP [Colwellia sp.]NQZ24890.1 protein-methionine-sulfoxide reductase catalytic subunit MsrP [Colwellia sp.]